MPTDRSTCEIRHWRLFKPGFWKDKYYSPAMVARLAVLFSRLKNDLIPVVKIGHDRSQRLAKSLGFLNVGRVADCRLDGAGHVALTLAGIPAEVGAQVNAGFLNSGSIELIPRLADPDNPAKDIEGPILSAVSLLGEERPAIPGFDPPRAVFPDGTPVPPATSPAKWLEAMAAVAMSERCFSAAPTTFSVRGREYTATSISFSEMRPDSPTGGSPVRVPADALLKNQMSDTGNLEDIAERLKAAGITDDATITLVLKALGLEPQPPVQNTAPDGGDTAQMSRLAAEVAKKKGELEEAEKQFAAFSAGYTGGRSTRVTSAGGLSVMKHLKHTNPRSYERLTGVKPY